MPTATEMLLKAQEGEDEYERRKREREEQERKEAEKAGRISFSGGRLSFTKGLPGGTSFTAAAKLSGRSRGVHLQFKKEF